MTRLTELVTFALGIGLLQGPAAISAPPQLGGTTPYGVQRGHVAEVTFSGTALGGNPRLMAPFDVRVEPAPLAKNSGESWTTRLTVPEGVALGIYPVRVQTDDGLSNPILLAVGQFAQLPEKEDNGSIESAQSIASVPVILEGQVAGNDVDYFRFKGRRGETIVVDALCARIGSGVDPSIRLTTASIPRRFVASADDSPGLLTDARLIARLPEDGDYLVEISDSKYQGGTRPIYRILVGNVPLAEEIYPLGGRLGETIGLEVRGGTIGNRQIAATNVQASHGSALHFPRVTERMMGIDSKTQPSVSRDLESLAPLIVGEFPELREGDEGTNRPVRAAAPIVFNGRIDRSGDEDRFLLAVIPGQRLNIRVEAFELGSALDGVLQVLGNGGTVIANADDTSTPGPPKNGAPTSIVSPDPSVEVTVPAATNEITLVLRDLEGRGGVGFPYRMVIRPVLPSFQIQLEQSEVSIPRAGWAAVAITVVRNNYSGPIAVNLANPPSGITCRPAMIGAGQDKGALTLSASKDGVIPAGILEIIGRAAANEVSISSDAVHRLIFARQESSPVCVRLQHGLAAAPSGILPLTLDAPTAPIEVAHGLGGTIPVKVARSKGSEGALAISTLPLPSGLAVPGVTIAEKSVEGSVGVNTTVDSSLGHTTIGLLAKGKIGGTERVLAFPAVTLNIVRPVEPKLSASSVEIKAGSVFEVKGKLIRRGGFGDPVSIKLTGLPSGLKADPVTVTAGVSDFTVKIAADSKASVGTTSTGLVLNFQVSKKDYPTPPMPLTVKVLAAR